MRFLIVTIAAFLTVPVINANDSNPVWLDFKAVSGRTAEKLLAGNLEEIILQVDFAASLGNFNHQPGRALSATPGRSGMREDQWQKLKALQFEHVRLWLMFPLIINPETKKETFGNVVMANYFAKYSSITQKILVNFPFGKHYRELVAKGKWTEAEYLDEMGRALEYFKRHYPKIEFVEIDNEPNASGEKPAGYYSTYSKACSVIAKINSKIAAGSLAGPSLKVGGPTLYKLDMTEFQKWMDPFLSAYAADPSPYKRLDFISYHQYLLRENPKVQDAEVYKDSPARVAGERAMIDATVKARGLPIVPFMITEGGLYAGGQPEPTPIRDFFIKASGQLALDYFYLNQTGIIPYRWTVDAIEPVKALFVKDGSGQWTGEPRPFYHATYFETQLPAQRYASDTLLDTKGMGIGTLAGGSPRKVAVLVWNYQWKNTTAKDFKMTLKHLPPDFKSKPVHVKIQAVRQTRDHGAPNLEKDETIAPSQDFSLPLYLGPNEFLFVELSVAS
ncbi:MAG: hypothetical protein WCH99_02655 [Verrucomicrobiota bacterium]